MLVPDGVRYGNAAAELCWANMVDNGRGCFWENDDPMFGARSPEQVFISCHSSDSLDKGNYLAGNFMKDGDKPPGNPSLCHPWSSGVTQVRHFELCCVVLCCVCFDRDMLIPVLIHNSQCLMLLFADTVAKPAHPRGHPTAARLFILGCCSIRQRGAKQSLRSRSDCVERAESAEKAPIILARVVLHVDTETPFHRISL